MKQRALAVLACIALTVFGLGAGKKAEVASVAAAPLTQEPAAAATAEPAATGSALDLTVPDPKAPAASDAARTLQQAQDGIGDMSADFALIITGAGTDGADVTAQGKMWLTKGRKYAVQYEQPERQRLVSDGTKRWLYLEKINQVQVQSLPPAGNPTEFFLELGGGLPALMKLCDVTRFTPGNEAPNTQGFELAPRPGKDLGFKRARLWLEGDHLVPRRVVVEAGRHVRAEFRNVKIHSTRDLLRDPASGIPASTFSFQPPQGAEVVPLF